MPPCVNPSRRFEESPKFSQKIDMYQHITQLKKIKNKIAELFEFQIDSAGVCNTELSTGVDFLNTLSL